MFRVSLQNKTNKTNPSIPKNQSSKYIPPTKKKLPPKRSLFNSKKSLTYRFKTQAELKTSAYLPAQPQIPLPLIQKSVTSNIRGAPVIAYAVNTHRGLVRKINEDKISIVENCKIKGELFHLFGLYDGHGGTGVAQFLSARLSQFIFQSQFFPKDIPGAIKNAFKSAEAVCLSSIQEPCPDRSGSCALIVLITDKQAWVANIGDSRAILLSNGTVNQITRDHRPNDQQQLQRIEQNGGKVYRQNVEEGQYAGPFRIKPGGLSVSRTIGDIGSKLLQCGGSPGVVIAEPDIHRLQLGSQEVQLLLGCDGVFEESCNDDLLGEIKRIRERARGTPTNCQLGSIVDGVLKYCMRTGSQDNLSAILLRLGRRRGV